MKNQPSKRAEFLSDMVENIIAGTQRVNDMNEEEKVESERIIKAYEKFTGIKRDEIAQ